MARMRLTSSPIMDIFFTGTPTSRIRKQRLSIPKMRRDSTMPEVLRNSAMATLSLTRVKIAFPIL